MPFSVLDNPPTGHPVDQAWFDDVSAFLLGDVALIAGDRSHRLVEIEFYYNGGDHPDPFAHCDPVQQTHRRWYFHRDEGSYRGGSFKGLDITFGEGAFGGILIRSLRADDGTIINGCSLCVDHLLRCTQKASVAELDGDIGDRTIDDTTSPLHLAANAAAPPNIWKTARVGLTLKRAYKFPEMPRYIMRPYRYLTEARPIKKGRVHHVIGLHKGGKTPEEIRALTNSPNKSITSYIADFEAGKSITSFRKWYGKSLSNSALCQMHGAWAAKYESP